MLPKAIRFDSGVAELPPGAGLLLEKVVRTLEAHPGIGLVVEGHADATEAAPSRLGLRRAGAVQRWLKAHGASCTVATVAVGAACPIASNMTGQGRRHNRRVEIQIRMPA